MKNKLYFLIILCLYNTIITAQTVSTLTPISVSFHTPQAITLDALGNMYVADTNNNKIRKITAAGVVSTLAGSGSFGSANGIGTVASFNFPTGIAVDASGNVYVADSFNNKIRKITSAGIVSTLAGSITNASGNLDGTGTAATFNSPKGVAVDASGNIYVADSFNHKIRKITPAGLVSTFAGSGSNGSADGTGILATFSYPTGLAIDASGNIYVADQGNDEIRKITAAGVVTTLAGSAGHVYPGSADGIGTAARFDDPSGVAVDASGTVYVADTLNHKIRKITTAGVVSTLSGSYVSSSIIDGAAMDAKFDNPFGVAVDASGNVYVADSDHHVIRKITTTGMVSTLAGSGSIGSADGTGVISLNAPSGIAVDTKGNMYVTNTGNCKIRKINTAGMVSSFVGSGADGSADGIGTTTSFKSPYGIAVDVSGNIYVADTYNHKIRKITTTGVVNTLAGSGAQGSADGVGAIASFNTPSSIAVDISGNVYVVDRGNHKIRKITAAGVVSTLAGSIDNTSGNTDGTGTAASFNSPYGVAVDVSGNVYVADTNNYKIRRITAAGVVSTFAGSGTPGSADGTGTVASFISPYGVTIDVSGNVYVTDMANNKVRKITVTGMVSTLAGSGSTGSADGIGITASFNTPEGIAVDTSGNLYIADTNNNIIRKISHSLITADFKMDSNLKIYPNPTTALLHIQTPNNISIDNVIIVDLTGKKMLEQTQNTSQIDVARLAKGMYIIEAFSGEEKFSSKFMKE